MQCQTLVLLLALALPEPVPAWKSDIVKHWARELGNELWQLSEALTKSDQIRIKYKQMNASVKQKHGDQILQSSLRSVSTMLTRKINAVKCIHATAEKLAREFNYTMIKDTEYDKSFKYCSAKYSEFEYEPGVVPQTSNVYVPKFAVNNSHYSTISLEKDSHFYNISVNTKQSCVHVPTNIYYKEEDALNAILWSEELNDVFIQNYESDPSLSWQYFGSSYGILRFYPGMPWNKIAVDTYDCRVKPWYIEAATCSKDVIILFDVSGSMTGFKNYVARRTLKSLLSTLSNNDYVNVYTFKNETSQVVNCFDNLVQATPENIQTIEKALEPREDGSPSVKLDGNADLAKAYIKAFTTLESRRQQCNVTSSQGCNQLVMLITDYVPGNLTEVFEKYNRETVDNKTYIPVRVFTFLIGKEVTNVREIRWMACLNRGYFVHIHSVEEVQQQVLKYINVIARPMILEGKEPPPTWTHANIDDTRTKFWNVSKDVSKPDEDKLVTSVAIPAFDYKYNEEHNDARLLGVAGTDVPIDSIARLAQPHQLGVNGYPLIVSNNGYLLLHPLLIATINDKLQINYNSVDFVEVEQVDDGKGPRELGEEIIKLRQALVDGDHGQMMGIKVLFHYDNMRRIARVKHDYFFNKLEGTPFSMGISLPQGYGDTELMLKDNPLEAKQGKDLTGINVTDYFRFSYRVHPDWVYCKYHYLEGHEAETPEIEIWRFLVLLSKNELNITKQQYKIENEDVADEINSTDHCGARDRLDKDEYYCTEDLVKQLVFDAKLTNPYFQDWHATTKDKSLAEKYKVLVRFIATSSGLTRWHYINEDDKNEYVNDDGTRERSYEGPVFGDIYPNAIEETWYKAAVLQHMINKESLVIGTKLPILDDTITNRPPVKNEDGNITLTASYAIFYKDGDSETPASVVGFQYTYKNFYDSFIDITQLNQTDDKDFKCGDMYACYLVDSSGYVVLSVGKDRSEDDDSDIGKFFGAIDADTNLVLGVLIKKSVFKYVEVFNYQALCPESLIKYKTSSGWSLTTPFSLARNFMRWLMSEILLLIINWNQYTYADDDDYMDTYDHAELPTTRAPPPPSPDVNAQATQKEEATFSCDRSIMLYILNQSFFLETMGLPRTIHSDKAGECHPPFWASYVQKTNLLLVVVERGNWKYGNCDRPPDTTPQATNDSKSSREPCHKLDLGGLPRRPLEGCFTYHEKEENITACGLGNTIRPNQHVFWTTAASAVLTARLFS